MPFSSLGGVRPYSKEECRETSSRKFNKDMERILNDKEYKDNFYNQVKGS